jgi:hypothetical protein
MLSFGEVMSDNCGVALCNVGELCLQHARYLSVQLLSAGLG